MEELSSLLTMKTTIDPLDAVKIKNISRRFENIAGVESSLFESIEFEEFTYNLFLTPPWVDATVIKLRSLAALQLIFKL